MYRALFCLTEEHTAWAVPLAALVCWFSCYVAMRLLAQTRTDASRGRFVWLVGAGVSTGIGIWSTHFIAMLGYDPGLGVGYDLPLTLLSLTIAGVAASLAFALAQRTTHAGGSAVAGVILGLGVAAMHFTGMAGVRVAGAFVWHPSLVAMALSIGCALAAAALVLSARPVGRHPHVLAASLLTGGIACLHFLAMAAVEVVPDPALAPEGENLPRGMLALGIAIGMVTVLAISALALFAEHLRRTNRILCEGERRLREKTALLDTVLENMDQGLMMIDAGGVVRVCNERALLLLDLPEPMMRAQPTFESVRQYQIARDDFIRSPEAFKRWVATRGLERVMN